MSFKKEQQGNITVITISGKIITQTAQELKKQFDAHCDNLTGDTLLVMEGVDYISSYFIGILIEALKKHKKQKCRFSLASVDPAVIFVFKIAGLSEAFTIYPNKEEAIADLTN